MTLATFTPRRSFIHAATTVLAIGGTALLIPLEGERAASSDVHLSVWVVIALFAIAESCVVHVHIKSEARTFSLSEIPLLLGLAYLSPFALVIGRLVGSGLALAIVRRQTPTKLTFNLSYFLLDTGLAIVVYRAVLGSAPPFEARGWIAALAATSTSLVVGAIAVSFVIAASDGRWMRSPLESLAGWGTVTAAVSTYFGVMAVNALAPVRMSPWLFAVGVGWIFAAYLAHSRVRRSAVHLEQLYGFSRAIAASLTQGAVDFALLEHTNNLLRADRAELILSDAESAAFITLHKGAVSVLNGRLADDALAGHHTLLAGRDAVLLGDKMIATLRTGDEVLGTLLVSDRLGEVDRFGEHDLQLFETLATHASICLRNYRLLERLRREADERHYQALHDALTGLPNRARLDDDLRHKLSRRGEGEAVVVMLIDLDRFKEVNDTLGHHQGDALLCKIGERIKEVVDDSTLVARLGGDEFAVVFTTTAKRDAIKAQAEAIERRLLEPFELDGLVFEVGSSIGIALAPHDGDDPSTLLQRADVAMYAAKRGAASAEFYDSDIDHASPRQLALAAELRRDIGRRALLVEYQPKAALSGGDVVGVEALARWHHSEYGFISPDVFIAIAERSGLIRPLTECVLDIALRQAAQWRTASTSTSP